MNKSMKKVLILLGIFILALAGYFLLSLKKGTNDIAYTAIEDADLPIAYMEMFGKEMNSLYGFLEDNYKAAGRSNLTVLPEERELKVSFYDTDSKIKGIQYEIRSLDGERLVERTVLENWNQEEDVVRASLPIQNLLTKEEEYHLTLMISTEKHPAVYYYTRIVWTDNSYIRDMLELAQSFSERTFSYETARELTTYLESDSMADNSSLGRVTLKNNFSQLIWRSMDIEHVGPVTVELKEMQGLMGMIQLSYVAARVDESGGKDYYDITECFTMKWNTQRIYMMDYDRRVNQIFSGDDSLYTGKRIMLGISDGEELQTISDEAGKYKAFVANKALWCYDTEKESSTKVFSFRKSEDDLRTNFNSHGVKILSVGGEGAVDFLVYGYMNRGNHEGTTGVALYRYESGDNSLTERLYVPSGEDYWSLKQNISKLSFLSDNQMLYLLIDHAVYGIDLSSKEYMVVADGLTEENFAVSEDGSRIAWQDGRELYESERLHVMNLHTGTKDVIYKNDRTFIRLVGFVGNDLVYGLMEPGEQLFVNGRIIGLPMYSLEIIGENMEVETRYEKEGIYLTDVTVKDSRIRMMKMIKTESGYRKTEEDTLVCNEEITVDQLAGIGYLASEEQGRLYFVQLDTESDKEQVVKLHVPKKVVAEEHNILALRPNESVSTNLYYAYSQGRMKGSYASYCDAVQAAYDGMGIVTDQNGRVFWVRAGRTDTKNIRDVQNYVPKIKRYLEEFSEGGRNTSDGISIVDARGCALNQILYFVYRGHPVAAFYNNGDYGIIYAYDQYNISCLWYPGTERQYTEKIGLNDAAAYFSANGENDFIAFLP